MNKLQTEISQWADSTFGKSASNLRIATRANEEMAELLKCLATDDNYPRAVEEAADVIIVLMRLFSDMGADYEAEVMKKMNINFKRQWKNDGSGHGYHVKS